jgi:DNA repair exonuclease SbcCD ATPase subunit
MKTDERAVSLHNLQRRRARARVNATRFSTLLDGFDDSTSLDDFEHYRRRLQETLDRLTCLDDAVHDLLSDNEYEEDIKACEAYIDKSKRAIQKASRRINNLSASTARLNIHGSTQPNETVPIGLVTHSVKLPAIKTEPFAGNVETWSRFWEQF